MAKLSLLSSGMTLIEIVVSVAIISIISAWLVAALPAVRSQQQLRSAITQIQSRLRAAQQSALNEDRPPACLARAGDDKAKQRRCSDVGVAVKGSDLVEFADLDGDKRLSLTADFIIARETIATAVSVPPKTWLFEATPPTITLLVDGRIQPANEPAAVTISAGSLHSTLQIFAYGYAAAQF